MLSYLGYLTGATLGPLVPRAIGLVIATWLGDLAALVSPSRRIVRDNLLHVLGRDADPRRVDTLVRAVFRTQARNYFDLFHLPRMSVDEIASLVDAHGLVEAMQRGSDGPGTVIVVPHFGNLDVTVQIAKVVGLPLAVVVERLTPDRRHQLIKGLRGRHGLELIEADCDARRFLRMVRDGRMLVLAADRDTTGSGATHEFFSAAAVLPDGYARLAAKTGARVGVAWSLRMPDGRFEVHYKEVHRPSGVRERREEVRGIVRSVLSEIERIVARHPEQWVIFQRIWPDEESEPS